MSGEFVLVVDDSDATRELVRAALEEMGLRTQEASNGAECLVAAAEERPALIILDVMMPVMDGFQALRVLRENPETKDTPVIMLTARSDEVDVVRGWQYQITEYVVKPFSVDHLVLLVRRVLETKLKAAAY